MNVTCTGCPAKYAVPDEKVRGKKVRITCKHCGTNIVVDGSTLGADAGAPVEPAAKTASAPVAASVATAAVAAAEPTFIVGFLDDRQVPHTLTQIVEMYRTGEIDDEVLVWKDGMPDWLSPFDVPEVAIAMLKRGVARRNANPDFSALGEEEQTLIARSPLDDPEFSAAPIATAPVLAAALTSGPAKPATQPAVTAAAATATPAAAPAPTAISAASAGNAPKVAAARRSEPRAAVDLFGGVASAGSEDDSSLDFGAATAAAEEPAHKLTGARNESSVLFSLDALTKPEAKANQKQKEREKEQEASAALFGESAPDSLMNVGGGGLAALAAPDFTKPAPSTVEPLRASPASEVHDTTPPNKKKGGWVLLLGSLFGIAAIAAGAFVLMKKQPFSASPATAPSAEASATTNAAPSSEASATSVPGAGASATPSAASAAPEASGSAANPVASAPTTGTAPAASAPASATTNKPAGDKKSETPATTTAPATPATIAKPEAAAPATPAAAAEGAAFDKSAAVAALGAAAANAGSCKQPNGPTGSGKVSVTFAPSGRATATSVAGDLAGTEVGGCVARLFRSAKVPSFTGNPVTVSKSFSVQ